MRIREKRPSICSVRTTEEGPDGTLDWTRSSDSENLTTGNLDAAYARDIIALLDSFNQLGATVVVATHDRLVLEQLPARRLTLDLGRLAESAAAAAA